MTTNKRLRKKIKNLERQNTRLVKTLHTVLVRSGAGVPACVPVQPSQSNIPGTSDHLGFRGVASHP